MPSLPILLALCSLGGDWPQFQGPSRNGTSPEEGLIGGFGAQGARILWSTEVGPGFGGAAVAGDEVWILDRVLAEADVLRCLALEDGRERWRLRYEAPGRFSYAGSRGVPTLAQGRVWTIGGFGHVSCFDAQARELLWQVDLRERFDAEPPRWGWAQSPLLHEGRLIVAPMTDEVGLAALDAATGETLWKSGPLGDGYVTPALVELGGREQLVFVGARGRGAVVAGLDPATGAELWRSDAYSNRIPIPAPARVDGRRLFVTGGYEGGSVMLGVERGEDGWSAQELFRTRLGSQVHLPLLVGEHLYFLANENANDKRPRQHEGGMTCMDLSGEVEWRTGAEPYMGRGNTILADGKLFVQDGFVGTLRIVRPNPERFEVLGAAEVFGAWDDYEDQNMWAPMALADGRLLMRSQEELKCVDLRPVEEQR